jgi:hypothetical protein
MILQAPSLLLAPLSKPPIHLPPDLLPRIASAASAFTAAMSAFLQFFKVILINRTPIAPKITESQYIRHCSCCIPRSLQAEYLPLCPVHSPSICRHAPNGADCYAACLKVLLPFPELEKTCL